MRHVAGLVAILSCAFGFAIDASAATCLGEVAVQARAYGISIDPPDAPPGDPPTAAELGRSGGVVEPLPTRDPAVIKPPPGLKSDMPTMPDITPSESAKLRPPDRSALQALLVAARDHARRGEEQACLRRLREARDFVDGLNR